MIKYLLSNFDFSLIFVQKVSRERPPPLPVCVQYRTVGTIYTQQWLSGRDWFSLLVLQLDDWLISSPGTLLSRTRRSNFLVYFFKMTLFAKVLGTQSWVRAPKKWNWVVENHFWVVSERTSLTWRGCMADKNLKKMQKMQKIQGSC